MTDALEIRRRPPRHVHRGLAVLVAFGGFATGLGGIRSALGRRLVPRPVPVPIDDRRS